MTGIRWGAVGRVVRSGVGRRRVQALVIAVATMMAVASAVVAGSLMVATDAPFDDAFASRHGAHLTVQFDTARADTAELRATGDLPGVTASAGPFPSTVFSPVTSTGARLPELTVVGRAGRHAEVDDLALTAGRWATGPGEVVLPASTAGADLVPGSTLRASDAADAPTLTVVGLARSVTWTADAWATPEQVRALAPDGRGTAQMLYRLAAAGDNDEVAAGRERIAEAVPRGALLGSGSYLDVKRFADQTARVTVPFLLAFGVLGIAMSVIIVGSVVSGAVGVGLRRIGILKAVGFTPGEVVRAYVAQALVPAGVGVALGVVLGNLMAWPLLEDTRETYGSASLTVAWWVDVLVAVGTLVTVGVAALVPALRAGRLRTVEAIAVGRAPRPGRGRRVHRAVGRLPLPRPVTYGLATPFAHPVRAVAMVLAVTFGTVAVTFATGLAASLGEVTEVQDTEGRADVTVITGPTQARANHPGGPPPGMPEPPSADPAEVRKVLEAQPGTGSYYGRAETDATVAGVSGRVSAQLYQGDSTSGALAMISGHWLEGPGQVVVPTRFLERTGTGLGDLVRVTHQGHSRSLRIVGEGFDTSDGEFTIHADLADFPAVPVADFLVDVAPGTSPETYASTVGELLRPTGGDAIVEPPRGDGEIIVLLNAMAALLTLTLAVVAGLGVLNAVVLDTRERVCDLGVCRALGMTPRQTVAMVLASVVGIGVVGGAVGVPVGFAVHGVVVPEMGRAAGTDLPAVVLDVYDARWLFLLGLAGVAIAVLGALLPAGWAARVRTATALRTE